MPQCLTTPRAATTASPTPSTRTTPPPANLATPPMHPNTSTRPPQHQHRAPPPPPTAPSNTLRTHSINALSATSASPTAQFPNHAQSGRHRTAPIATPASLTCHAINPGTEGTVSAPAAIPTSPPGTHQHPQSRAQLAFLASESTRTRAPTHRKLVAHSPGRDLRASSPAASNHFDRRSYSLNQRISSRLRIPPRGCLTTPPAATAAPLPAPPPPASLAMPSTQARRAPLAPPAIVSASSVRRPQSAHETEPSQPFRRASPPALVHSRIPDSPPIHPPASRDPLPPAADHHLDRMSYSLDQCTSCYFRPPTSRLPDHTQGGHCRVAHIAIPAPGPPRAQPTSA